MPDPGGTGRFPRTLILTGHLAPHRGGVESVTEQIARRLPPGSVVMMAPELPGCAEVDDRLPWEVIRYPGRMLTSPGLGLRVQSLARERGIEAAWITSAMPLAALSVPLRRAGVARIVVSTHGMEAGWASVPPAAALMRVVARHIDVVTYLGEITRDRLAPAIPAGTTMMRLTGGVDADRFTPDAVAAGIRDELGWGTNREAETTTRLVLRKGQDTLLRAWPEIRHRHRDARLLIVGDGPRRTSLERLAESLGVTRDVRFAGSVADADLPSYLAAGDVFALPCRDLWRGLQVEGLGLSILEASAVGLPVVVGRSGGTPDAVVDGVTGHLVDATSVTPLARAITRLLDDPAGARAMGADGRAWVTREWSWDRLADRLRGALCSSDVAATDTTAVPAGTGAEAFQAFLHVPQRHQAVRELVGHRVGVRESLLLQQGEPVLTQAGLREAGDLPGQRLSGGPRLPDRHDPVDQPHSERLLRRDPASGQNEVHRP
jgi:phosphatidylinositol alpha-1,6-mannosyltransferase